MIVALKRFQTILCNVSKISIVITLSGQWSNNTNQHIAQSLVGTHSFVYVLQKTSYSHIQICILSSKMNEFGVDFDVVELL